MLEFRCICLIDFMKKIALLITIFALTVGIAIAQKTGGVKGQVRTFDGDPISDVKVTARQDGKNLKSVQSDRKGKFILDGLKPGVYNFVFSRKGFTSGLKAEVEIDDNIRNLGDDLFLDVDRGTQVIINGSVFGKDGYVIPGAKIKIEKVLENGKTKKLGTGYTNRQGEFVFRFKGEAAKFRITASAKGKKDVKEWVTEEAAIYRLALNLDLERK